MGLTSQITRRLEVPGEDGAFIEYRMLSWLTIDKAKKVREPELLAHARTFIGVDIPKPEPGQKQDRLLQFDVYTLLKHGVVGWSYEGEVDIERLDAATAELAARAILDYALPELSEIKGPASPSTGT